MLMQEYIQSGYEQKLTAQIVHKVANVNAGIHSVRVKTKTNSSDCKLKAVCKKRVFSTIFWFVFLRYNVTVAIILGVDTDTTQTLRYM